MRIGVISDTHISSAATRLPQQVLDEFKKADMVLHAGDLVSLSAIEQIKSVCPNVIAVHGNMDGEEVRKALPEKQIFNVGKIRVVLTHGWGGPSSLVQSLETAFKNEKPDIVVFGHSHSAVNQKVGNVLYFNPGSPTDKAFSAYNSYGIIDIVGEKIEAKIVKL